jgi:hypothetical protein
MLIDLDATERPNTEESRMLDMRTHDRAQREVATLNATDGFAHDARVVELSGAVSGRESKPDYFYGHAVSYVTAMCGECFKFWPGDEIRDVLTNVYVINGHVYYVAGWQGDGTANRIDGGYVLLHPYSVEQGFMPHRAVFLCSVDL